MPEKKCQGCGIIYQGRDESDDELILCPRPGCSDDSKYHFVPKENQPDRLCQEQTQPPVGWHAQAVLMDEIQVLLNEAWTKFCRLKDIIVPDPPTERPKDQTTEGPSS